MAVQKKKKQVPRTAQPAGASQRAPTIDFNQELSTRQNPIGMIDFHSELDAREVATQMAESQRGDRGPATIGPARPTTPDTPREEAKRVAKQTVTKVRDVLSVKPPQSVGEAVRTVAGLPFMLPNAIIQASGIGQAAVPLARATAVGREVGQRLEREVPRARGLIETVAYDPLTYLAGPTAVRTLGRVPGAIRTLTSRRAATTVGAAERAAVSAMRPGQARVLTREEPLLRARPGTEKVSGPVRGFLTEEEVRSTEIGRGGFLDGGPESQVQIPLAARPARPVVSKQPVAPLLPDRAALMGSRALQTNRRAVEGLAARAGITMQEAEEIAVRRAQIQATYPSKAIPLDMVDVQHFQSTGNVRAIRVENPLVKSAVQAEAEAQWAVAEKVIEGRQATQAGVGPVDVALRALHGEEGYLALTEAGKMVNVGQKEAKAGRLVVEDLMDRYGIMHIANWGGQDRVSFDRAILRQFGADAQPYLDKVWKQSQAGYAKLIRSTTTGKLQEVGNLFALWDRGELGHDWYDNIMDVLVTNFGPKRAERMAHYLAATSKGATVEANVELAIKALIQEELGLPPSGLFLGGKEVAAIRAGQPWGGRKVRNFIAAILGDENAYVHDRWMQRIMGFKGDVPNDLQYDQGEAAINIFRKQLSEELGREVTTRQVQAALWTGIKDETGTLGKNFSSFTEMLQNNPALKNRVLMAIDRPAFANAQDLKRILTQGDRWAILTADNPGLKVALRPRKGESQVMMLIRELADRGFTADEVYRVRGWFPDAKGVLREEQSVFIKNISSTEAWRLGKALGQRAVVTPEGLLWTKTRLMNPNGPLTVVPEARAGQLLPGGHTIARTADGQMAAFSVGYDWDKLTPHPAFEGPEGFKGVGERIARGIVEERGAIGPRPAPKMIWDAEKGEFVDDMIPGLAEHEPVTGSSQRAAALSPRPAGPGAEVAPEGLVTQLAKASGVPVDSLRLAAPDGVITAAHARQGVKYLMTNAANVRRTAKALTEKMTDENYAAFADAVRSYANLRARLTGLGSARSEAVRDFRWIMQHGELPPAAREPDTLLQLGDVQDLARRMSKSTDIQKDLADALTPTRWRQFIEAATAVKLTSPRTHIRNTVSNVTAVLIGMAEVPISATLEVVRSGGGLLRPRERFYGETFAEIAGMLTSVQDASSNFVKALSHERQMAAGMAHEAAQYGGVARGLRGKITQFPFRLLDAEDQFFRTINQRRLLYKEAYRKAAGQGEWVELADRVSDFVRNPDSATVARVQSAAKEYTFQNELGAVGQWLMNFRDARGMKDGPTKEGIKGVMRLLAPFMKTPINVNSFAARHTPAGLYSGLRGATSKGAQSDVIARATIGPIIAASGVMYALGGNITGIGPKDPEQRAMWEAGGNHAESIRVSIPGVGRYWVEYRGIEPLATFLRMSAAMRDDHVAGKNVGDITRNIISYATNAVMDSTWLGQMDLLNDLMRDPTERTFNRFVGGVLTGFVPRVFADVAKTVDPIQRRGESIQDRILRDIPFASKTVDERLDPWGNPKYHPGSPWRPGVWKDDPAVDPVSKEMVNLGIDIQRPAKKKTVEGVKVARTQRERQSAEAVRGRYAREAVIEAMSDPYYNYLTKEERLDLIKKAKKEALERAEEEMEE